MSTYTLYTDPGNFRAFKILIAAEYNSTDIKTPKFELGKDNQTPSFLAKSPQGRVPVLEVVSTSRNSSGIITESNAIARFVAKLRADTELLGATLLESAQVDSWLDYSAHNIELPATMWLYPVLGYMPANEAMSAKAKEDLLKALKVLENHLVDKTYLVGNAVTLADICVCSALIYPFKFLADAKYREAVPNVTRWFSTCVNQPAFISVVGTVEFAKTELKAAGSAKLIAAAGGGGAAGGGKGGDKAPKEKKEKAPAAPKEAPKPKEKKEKEVEEEDDYGMPPPEKKEDHIFKLMDQANKSTFVMDTWKKTYSNADDYAVAMNTFWETIDTAGWSIFRGDYKYNEECKVLFMTSNLIAGFIQRTEEIRKWLFGTMTIRGVEGGEMKITCYFLIRGDSIDPLLKCNDDAECYEWTKMPMPASAEDKVKLMEYWTSETTLEGEPCLDSRAYK